MEKKWQPKIPTLPDKGHNFKLEKNAPWGVGKRVHKGIIDTIRDEVYYIKTIRLKCIGRDWKILKISRGLEFFRFFPLREEGVS